MRLPRLLTGGQVGTAILCVLACAASAHARTWRVLRDGSGDFTTLQPASNAAAAGDTIWIGPGRYTEKTDFVVNSSSGLTWQVYLGITKDDLTIIGAHRDSVVIGPDVRVSNEVGIVSRYGTGANSTIESLTVHRVFRGIEHEAPTTIRNVRLEDCGSGILGTESSALIDNCEFESCNYGIAAVAPSMNYKVDSCRFIDNLNGINFTGSRNPVIERCRIEGGGTGIVASGFGVRLQLRNSEILDAANGCIYVASDAEVRASDCTFATSGAVALRVSSGGYFELLRSRVSGGWWTAIEFGSQRDPVVVKNNEILRGTGYAVRADCYLADFDSVVLDLSGNYWGTVDEDSLRAWIWDRNDDPNEFARVLYSPFLSEYVPLERRSFGSLKTLFSKP